MSRFQAFGISLEPMALEHLELVRHWRNHPDVAKHMLQSEPISRQQHAAWFDALSARDDQCCLLAYFRDQPVAVANLKALDGQPLTGHPGPQSGLYLAPGALRQSMLAFLPALALHQWTFEILGCGRLEAIVLKENLPAQRFNRALGYVDSPEATKPSHCIAMTLTQAAHSQASQRFARFNETTTP